MKKVIAVICILVIGFIGGFYLSNSSLFNSSNNQKPATASNAPATTNSNKPATNNGNITEDEAQTIALHDANVSPNGIYNMRSHAENYYGVDIYDVEFDTEDKQYNYNIDRQNGDIYSMDYEVDDRYLRNLPDNPISEQEAIDLVMQNISGAQTSDIKLRRDHDDHYAEYEGQAIVNNVRYEFTINADKGIIKEWDVDYKTH